MYPDRAGITDATQAIATSQVALPQNVFGDDSGALQLATVTGDVTSSYQVTLNVGVDTTTKPAGGQPPSP